MEFAEKKRAILEFKACDHCLGRQFHSKIKAPNELIGAAVRKSRSIKEATRLAEKGRLPAMDGKECMLCGGLFIRIPEAISSIKRSTSGLEYSTFLMGCRIPAALMENEEKLFSKIGMDGVESIKREVNRLIGKEITKETGKAADFKSPDLNIVHDFSRNSTEVQVNPLFIYGRYQKLERGLPQTKWPCSSCMGRGCKECGNTGKQYKETVEDLVASVVLAETGGKDTKFHGHGREDKDARMLGEGRPFILEVDKPVRRDIDWKKLEKAINDKFAKKIRITGLRPSGKEEVVIIKTITFDKCYRALVKCESPPSKEELKKLEGLAGMEISQKTPTRVLHRRADKVRVRKIKSIKCRPTKKPDEFECEITAEAGTYIKELITGDFGRTIPSFAGITGKNCECKELDVMDIIEIKK